MLHPNASSYEHIEDRVYNSTNPKGKYTAPYLRVEFVNTQTPITLYCNEHKVEWKTRLENIYRGAGCPQCAKEKIQMKLRKDPLEKIKEVEDRVGEGVYDFSRVPKDAKISDLVEIRCVKHNEWFSVKLEKLAKKAGCSSCSQESRMEKYNKRTEENLKNLPCYILTDDWRSHKGRKTDYTNLYRLECKTCGHHYDASWPALWTKGADLCVVCGTGRIKDNTEFVKKVNYKRDSEKPSYDLSMFDYTGYDKPSKVICHEHGFCQSMSPRSLMDGRVLHCCWIAEHHGGWNISRLNEDMKGKAATLYHIRFTSPGGKVFDKVGITTKSIEARFWAASKHGYTYEVVRTCEESLYNCVLLEHLIKESLKESDRMYRVHDFKIKDIGGWTECFYPMGGCTNTD